MKVHLIKVALHADSAFLISQPELEDGVIDRPASRDGWGEHYIPGTSVAGSLRDHLRDLGVEENWMGSAGTADTLTASALWIQGTRLNDAAATYVSQTAIDPTRGAARPKTLRTSEMLLEGATLDVAMRVDGQENIDDLLVSIASWRPRLGASTSTGLGHFSVASIDYGSLDLSHSDDLDIWIRLSGWGLHDKVCSDSKTTPDSMKEHGVSCGFSIREGLHIGGHSAGSDNHMYRRSDGSIVIEGPTLKGLLRSRCAFILRSFGIECCEDPSVSEGCTCPTCRIFGSVSARAAVSVAAAPITEPTCRWDQHVAIDRITGGAAAGRLWKDEVVVSGNLKIVVEPLGAEATEPWMVALIEWVFRDLSDGVLRIGAKTTRGYGAVEALDGEPVKPSLDLPDIIVGIKQKVPA